MPLTNISAYRLAGHQIEDEDIDPDARLETSKFATRTLRKTIPAVACLKAGAGVVELVSGSVLAGVTLPDANAGNLYMSFPKPAEYDSGDVVLKILWNSAATAGDLKLTSDIKTATTGSTTASGATDSGTDTADGTTTDLSELSITIAAADFNANEFIGLNISRDPTDVADDIAADVIVFAIAMEFTGRG